MAGNVKLQVLQVLYYGPQMPRVEVMWAVRDPCEGETLFFCEWSDAQMYAYHLTETKYYKRAGLLIQSSCYPDERKY